MIRRFPRRILIIFLAGLGFAGAAFAETVSGNGAMRKQERAVSGFTGVALGIPARVEVTLGAAEGITIEADENLLPLIETQVERGSLNIKPVRRDLNLSSKNIRIVVNAKQLEKLAIGGPGSISADGVKANSLNLSIGGSGDIKVSGAAQRVKIAIGGSGNADARSLVADEADVTIAGSGEAAVAARASLKVTIAGSGDVSYWGDPALSRTIVGSASISRAGPLPQ